MFRVHGNVVIPRDNFLPLWVGSSGNHSVNVILNQTSRIARELHSLPWAAVLEGGLFVFTALTEDCCVSSPRQVPGPFSLWSWLQYFLLLSRKIVSIVTAPILSRHAESSRIFRWGNIWGLQLTSVMPVFLALGPVEIHCFAMPPISPNRS